MINKVYIVYSYTLGEEYTEGVFTSREKAIDYIIDEIKNNNCILKDEYHSDEKQQGKYLKKKIDTYYVHDYANFENMYSVYVYILNNQILD